MLVIQFMRLPFFSFLGNNGKLLLSLFIVSFIVELTKQEEKEDGVEADPPNKSLGVVAINKEKLEGMNHYQHELYHLQGRQVLLPPKVGLNARAQGREEVVRVHHNVDKGIK
jgi:hypothetical protein